MVKGVLVTLSCLAMTFLVVRFFVIDHTDDIRKYYHREIMQMYKDKRESRSRRQARMSQTIRQLDPQDLKKITGEHQSPSESPFAQEDRPLDLMKKIAKPKAERELATEE